MLPVTVIITAFERTAFLRGAIESVLAQRLPPREIVVCDDSSSPAIRDICAAFGDRLEYRANPQSLGVAATVREAILAAKHPFVAILNDDDCWEPHFLGTLVPALLDHRDCVLSFGDHWIMDEAGCVDRDATERNTRLYGRDRLATGQLSDTADLVLLQNAVPLAMSAVFRHEGIDWSLVTPEVGGAYDFWVTCLLSATGRPFAWSPVRVSRYRIHGKMETARRSPARSEPLVHIFERLAALDWFPGRQPLFQRQLALAWRACGRDHLRQGDKSEARQCFLHSLKARPTLKSALGCLASFLPF